VWLRAETEFSSETCNIMKYLVSIEFRIRKWQYGT
jgi:hypothetical protein